MSSADRNHEPGLVFSPDGILVLVRECQYNYLLNVVKRRGRICSALYLVPGFFRHWRAHPSELGHRIFNLESSL